MRKRSRIVGATLVVACLVIVAWEIPWSRHNEPMYEGKPLGVWLKAYVSAPGPAQLKADEAILHVGTNAIPTLLQMLRERDLPGKAWLQYQLRKWNFTNITSFSASDRNFSAGYAFGTLGSGASNAVPELMAIYNRHYSQNSESGVIIALGGIGPPARDAVPMLISATTNQNWAVMANAFVSLARIHAYPELCVPMLSTNLSGPDAFRRRKAIYALGTFGELASNSVPILLPLLSDPDYSIRRDATNALQAIRPEAIMKAEKK